LKAVEIIKLTATYLQLEDVLELSEFGGQVQTPSEQTNKNLNLLLRCLNLVYNEIATEYIPLKHSEYITVTNEKFDYINLNKNIVDVLSLVTTDNKTAKYKTYPTHLKLRNGDYNIEYSYLPVKVTLEESTENFANKITERIFAYGVASEYCVISGLYDEASLWQKRFKDSVLISSRKKTELVMPARRWL